MEIYVKLLRGEACYLQLVNDMYTEIEGENVNMNLQDTDVCVYKYIYIYFLFRKREKYIHIHTLNTHTPHRRRGQETDCKPHECRTEILFTLASQSLAMEPGSRKEL